MKILKLIGSYWKGITAIASAVTFIWVASAKYENKRIADEAYQKALLKGDSIQQVHAILTDTRLERIERGMYDLNLQVSDQREETQALRKTLIQSFAKNPGITKEDYDYLMNILLDIKKNNSSTSMIP